VAKGERDVLVIEMGGSRHCMTFGHGRSVCRRDATREDG
jgi:hypothetical protein